MLRKLIAFTSISLLTVSAFISASAYASDAQSMRKLNAMAAVVRLATGAHCRDSANGKYLSEGGSYTIKTTLFRGYSYVILGAGDSSTRDLDIIVYDENFNRVKSDTKADNEPIVEVTPRWTGTFYLRGKMYSGSGYSNIAICHVER